MLTDALRQHARKNYGSKPRRFVMHPAVLQELVVTLKPSQRFYVERDKDCNYRFMGVEIETDMHADRAKLIDVNNVIVYL